MNINVSSYRKYALYSFLCNFSDMLHFKQIIKYVIHLVQQLLVLVSDCDKISQSGVLDTCIGDHMPIYRTRKLQEVSLVNIT